MWGKDKLVNEIEFVALDKYSFEVCPKPFPASQGLPKWWKDASPYIKNKDNPDGKKIILENGYTSPITPYPSRAKIDYGKENSIKEQHYPPK